MLYRLSNVVQRRNRSALCGQLLVEILDDRDLFRTRSPHVLPRNHAWRETRRWYDRRIEEIYGSVDVQAPAGVAS